MSTNTTTWYGSMTTSSTPLHSQGQQGGFASGAGAFANQVFSKENASRAQEFTRDTGSKLRQMARDGDFSIRLFALLGGLAMIATSILGVLGKVINFHFVEAIILVYVFLLGIAVLLLEGRKQIPLLSQEFEANLYKYCLFLQFVWGRGCLYFIAGTLQISASGLLNLIVGLFMCFVGIMFITVGRQASAKVTQMRSAMYSDATLHAEFKEADIEQDGFLTIDQFKVLTTNLNMTLNRRELETLFLQIDQTNQGRITFPQFLAWWKGHNEPGAQAPSTPHYATVM